MPCGAGTVGVGTVREGAIWRGALFLGGSFGELRGLHHAGHFWGDGEVLWGGHAEFVHADFLTELNVLWESCFFVDGGDVDAGFHRDAAEWAGGILRACWSRFGAFGSGLFGCGGFRCGLASLFGFRGLLGGYLSDEGLHFLFADFFGIILHENEDLVAAQRDGSAVQFFSDP